MIKWPYVKTVPSEPVENVRPKVKGVVVALVISRRDHMIRP